MSLSAVITEEVKQNVIEWASDLSTDLILVHDTRTKMAIVEYAMGFLSGKEQGIAKAVREGLASPTTPEVLDALKIIEARKCELAVFVQ